MNRLRFNNAAWMPKTDRRFESLRLQHLLHRYAECRGFAHRFEELSSNSRPDVVRTDRERRPRSVFVGNAAIASDAAAAGIALHRHQQHLHDFHQCVRWGVGGLFAIATDSLAVALDLSPRINLMAASEKLIDVGAANFRVERFGIDAWLIILRRFEGAPRDHKVL